MRKSMIVSNFDSLQFISGGLSGERYPGFSGRNGGAIALFKNIFRPISKDDGVYDMDNLRVTTPKRHIDIHRGK